MDKIISHTKEKPEQVKKYYALGIAVFFTVIIVGVWALGLGNRFSEIKAQGEENGETGPIQAFSQTIGNMFQEAKKSYKNPQSANGIEAIVGDKTSE